MLKFVLITALVVIAAAQNDTDTSSQSDTDAGYDQGYGEGQVPFPLGGSMPAPGGMQMYGDLLLEWQSAQAWMQYGYAFTQTLAMDRDGNGVPDELEYPSRSLEEDQDLEEEDEEIAVQPYTNGPAGLHGSPDLAANAYNNFPYIGAPSADPVQSMSDLEESREHALALITKIQVVENVQKMLYAQSNSMQNKMVIMVVYTAAGQNPLAMQVLYLLKYKDMVETISSSIGLQKQDVWNTWNTFEMLETVEDALAKDENGDFAETLAHYKYNCMSTFYMEAMLDLQTFFIDYYVQMLVGQAMGSLGSSAAPAGSSVPPPQQQAYPSGNVNMMEVEETAEPFIPAGSIPAGSLGSLGAGSLGAAAAGSLGALGAGGSLAATGSMAMFSPQVLMYYTAVLTFYQRFLNLHVAQVWFQIAQMELFSFTADDEAYEKSAADMSKFLNILDYQLVYGINQWASIKMILAYVKFIFMALPVIGGSLAAGPAGSLGSLGGSLGGSLNPATSLAPLAFGSLGPVGGSLSMGSLGSLGGGSIPAAGSSALPFMGAAGNTVVSHASANHAAMAFANLLQKEASAEKPAEANTPFPAQDNVVA